MALLLVMRVAANLPLSYAPLTKPAILPAVASPANINFSAIGSLSTSRPKTAWFDCRVRSLVNGLLAQSVAKTLQKVFSDFVT